MPRTDTTFKKGKSGNAKGRPKGIQDRRTALRELLDPHSKALVKKAVEMAKEGDMGALRLCLERLIPPIKSKDDPVIVKGLKGDASLVKQGQVIVSAMAAGDITPAEASTLIQAISQQARIIEIEELEKRLATLEKKYGV